MYLVNVMKNRNLRGEGGGLYRFLKEMHIDPERSIQALKENV